MRFLFAPQKDKKYIWGGRSALKYDAVCCSVCVAVCWGVLQCVCQQQRGRRDEPSVLQCVAEYCSVMQCVAVCCSVLQCMRLPKFLQL